MRHCSYPTERLSLTQSIRCLNGSGLKVANFLMMMVGLTVNSSFVRTSLSYLNALSMSVGAIANEKLSVRITDVIFATI